MSEVDKSGQIDPSESVSTKTHIIGAAQIISQILTKDPEWFPVWKRMVSGPVLNAIKDAPSLTPPKPARVSFMGRVLRRRSLWAIIGGATGAALGLGIDRFNQWNEQLKYMNERRFEGGKKSSESMTGWTITNLEDEFNAGARFSWRVSNDTDEIYTQDQFINFRNGSERITTGIQASSLKIRDLAGEHLIVKLKVRRPDYTDEDWFLPTYFDVRNQQLLTVTSVIKFERSRGGNIDQVHYAVLIARQNERGIPYLETATVDKTVR